MSSIELAVVWIAIGFTLINLGILGLNMKLYTEYFKDRAMLARK
jgi:hypothetical protein